jgi:hypothetical protein
MRLVDEGQISSTAHQPQLATGPALAIECLLERGATPHTMKHSVRRTGWN